MRRVPEGVIDSHNIWQHPATYELENQVFYSDGRVVPSMRGRADCAGSYGLGWV